MAPRAKKPATRSLKKLRFGSLYRDLTSRNTLHQRLDYLGPKVYERAIEGNYDLIHAHGLAAAALLAHKSGFRPYTISVWGSDILLTPSSRPYMIPLMKEALRDSSFIHVQGNIGSSKVLEMCPECENKIVVRTWGADTEAFRPGLKKDHITDLALGQSKLVLSFRALYPLYRTETILSAFAKISQHHNDAVLVIGSDGSERENLEKISEKLGLDNRVRFIGHVARNEMRQLFSNAYLYVQFPESDGVTITGMEAMCSGLPLISSNVGDISVLIEHGVNGFLVDDESVDTLASYIDKLLSDKTLRDEMGSKSRQLALDKHDRKSFFKMMKDRMKSQLEV